MLIKKNEVEKIKKDFEKTVLDKISVNVELYERKKEIEILKKRNKQLLSKIKSYELQQRGHKPLHKKTS